MKARCIVTPILVVSCIIALAAAIDTSSECSSVTLETRHLHKARVHVITANLNDPSVRVEIGLPEKGISHSEPFLRMVRRHAPVAAVTGTYFDTRTLFPVGSIIVKGKTAFEGAIGTAVCFVRPDGLVCATDNGPTQAARPRGYAVRFAMTAKGERFSWQGVDTGFRTGPLLLRNGRNSINARREGFKHPGLFGPRTRIALGLTGHNKLLLVAVDTPVTFERLAGIMKALGAVDAVALDGGTSSAMYYRGRFVRYPGRALTNIIEIYETNLLTDQMARTTGTLLKTQPTELATAKTTSPYIARQVTDLSTGHLSVFSLALQFDSAMDYAVIPVPTLAAAKGRHALFPVHRTKLAGLKGGDHTYHFIHIAANIKIMHHLVA